LVLWRRRERVGGGGEREEGMEESVNFLPNVVVSNW
jgi:hypothetical protein